MSACSENSSANKPQDTPSIIHEETSEQTKATNPTEDTTKTSHSTVVTEQTTKTETTETTQYTRSELEECATKLFESVGEYFSSMDISDKLNRVRIWCPDAENEAILKSRLKDLGIDEDIIAFQPYEKRAEAMMDH